MQQSARIVSIRKVAAATTASDEVTECLKSEEEMASICNGEKAVVRFRFLYYPEYLTVNSAVIIREERTKGVGTVVKLIS